MSAVTSIIGKRRSPRRDVSRAFVITVTAARTFLPICGPVRLRRTIAICYSANCCPSWVDFDVSSPSSWVEQNYPFSGRGSYDREKMNRPFPKYNGYFTRARWKPVEIAGNYDFSYEEIVENFQQAPYRKNKEGKGKKKENFETSEEIIPYAFIPGSLLSDDELLRRNEKPRSTKKTEKKKIRE